jgi:quercetin dioxygenase-like cupin family protein
MPQNTSPCTILPPGAGDAWWVVGDHITFKLGPDRTGGRFAFAETIVAPGGGPPPHVHHREDEMFYIIDGQFAFISGEHTLTGSMGDAVYLPKDIVHTFKNVGSTPARVLVGAAPSGFEKFVPEAGCRCDEKTPTSPPVDDAAIGKLMAACEKYGLEMKFDFKPGGPAPARAADREFWVAGSHVRIKLTGADTRGNFTMFETTLPPGSGYPPHAHRERDDVIFILEGSVDFDLAGQQVSAAAGTFIHIPPQTKFSAVNSGNSAARLLDCVSPGGFEAFFEEIGIPCTDRSAPPPAGPVDLAQLAAVFAKHGMAL